MMDAELKPQGRSRKKKQLHVCAFVFCGYDVSDLFLSYFNDSNARHKKSENEEDKEPLKDEEAEMDREDQSFMFESSPSCESSHFSCLHTQYLIVDGPVVINGRMRRYQLQMP